jgi:non-homologous end joining protein Ku
MAPRAYWKGYLRLSLVSCPKLLQATLDDEKATDQTLTKIAETVVNQEAEAA